MLAVGIFAAFVIAVAVGTFISALIERNDRLEEMA
jgi:hypothetical protein